MGCACGGGKASSTQDKETAQYLVSLPNGNHKTVTGETQAKIEVTMAGGGTFSMIK